MMKHATALGIQANMINLLRIKFVVDKEMINNYRKAGRRNK